MTECPTFKGMLTKCIKRGSCSWSRSHPDGAKVMSVRSGVDVEIHDEMKGHVVNLQRRYAMEVGPWMDKGFCFITTVTGRIGCARVITMEPIKGAEETKETKKELEEVQ